MLRSDLHKRKLLNFFYHSQNAIFDVLLLSVPIPTLYGFKPKKFRRTKVITQNDFLLSVQFPVVAIVLSQKLFNRSTSHHDSLRLKALAARWRAVSYGDIGRRQNASTAETWRLCFVKQFTVNDFS